MNKLNAFVLAISIANSGCAKSQKMNMPLEPSKVMAFSEGEELFVPPKESESSRIITPSSQEEDISIIILENSMLQEDIAELRIRLRKKLGFMEAIYKQYDCYDIYVPSCTRTKEIRNKILDEIRYDKNKSCVEETQDFHDWGCVEKLPEFKKNEHFVPYLYQKNTCLKSVISCLNH